MGKDIIMKGIELSKKYFYQIVLPSLEKDFPFLCDHIAAGLVAGGFASGCGSEVGGFDDEISRDHNWGPRVFLFLSEDHKTLYGEKLQEYLDSSLPKEFEGFQLKATTLQNNNAYIVTPGENLKSVLHIESVPNSDAEWLSIPELLLFEYNAGEIFYEPKLLVSPLKEQFSYFPDDIWYKRLAFAFFTLHAAGNANRMVMRGDVVATNAYVSWLLQCVMRTCFLFRRRFAPYIKWRFQAFKQLQNLPDGIISQIEKLAERIDLTLVEQQIIDLLTFVGTMANESGLIEPLPLFVKSPYIWTDFNCYGFMNKFEEKIKGSLRGRPYEGPLDMWVENHLPIDQKLVLSAWNK